MFQQTYRKAAFLLLILITAIGGALSGGGKASAAGSLELYSPYLEWSAAPGESVSYTIDLVNHGSSTASANLSLETQSKDWTYELTAGGREISRLAVKAGETQTFNLDLDVPLQVNKGRYVFNLKADEATLPLVVNVSEQGTFKTELTLDQANMEGHSDSTFTYSAVLRNRTTQKQTYAFSAQVEQGWDVRFKADGNSVTSVEVEPTAEKTITIEVKPPEQIKAGTYEIPIAATSGDSTANAKIEAVVTGSYDMKFSTTDDRLSTDVGAGSERKLTFVVQNTGSAELQDLSFSSSAPTDWEVSFEPSSITTIAPGESKQIQATIKSSKKSLPGDYVVSLTASSANKSANADLRVTVKSSVLWGWVGVLIILAVCGGIYYLFRKYGRR
ncbi:NEW3 domain-containing protein [Paenibacillus sp. MBLB2552]|uniref:NEW3 domain-containing protein n=1 Tax=Paenibacillus mellifer TaxID=2937794 RepID=A0A9X1XV28_9BACL|nr:NEW3 domain-containing protein [Paenibacillus mellifer]MCK8485877.1 NEW3 domain-containing protein [Paenibacillus mellifer]